MNTPLNSQAHYDMIEQFERSMKKASNMPSIRTAKEDKSLWAKGNVYQDGMTNQLFLVYRLGHAYGTAVAA